MYGNRLMILSLVLTLLIGGSEELNNSKYPQFHQGDEAGFDQLYIMSEDGRKDVVYQYQETKQLPNQNEYEQGIDYLEKMKLPYVRNIASLIYAGYPNYSVVGDTRFDLAYGLSESDEYEYFDELVRENQSYTHIIRGSSLAYSLTQRALSDCLAIYQDSTLDTKEKFNVAIENLKRIRNEEYALLGTNKVLVYRNVNGQDVPPQQLDEQGQLAANQLSSFYNALIDAAIYLQVPMVNEQINKERLLMDDIQLKKDDAMYRSGLFSIDSLDGTLIRYQLKDIEEGVEIYDHLHGLIHEDTWLNSGENIEIVSDHELVNLHVEYEFTQNQRLIYYTSQTSLEDYSDLIGIGETKERLNQTFQLSLSSKSNKGIVYLIVLIVFAFLVALLSIYLDRRKQK